MAIEWAKSETEILFRILDNRQLFANTVHFALASAFPCPEAAFGCDVYVGVNIQRGKLNLNLRQRPGDVDYLIIPVRDERVLTDRIIAIEAKIVRPTIKNPSRNANSMGRSQIEGLLHDGFPFVGLLHIAIPEPLPAEAHWKISELTHSLGADGKLLESGRYFVFDPFPLLSAQRQEGRVLSLNLPDEVAYRVIGIEFSQSDSILFGCTIGEYCRGKRNSRESASLTAAVESLLGNEPGLFQKVCWFPDRKG
ncbi:hypothetical protein [Pseudomonas citronellolis]|jgi:hypothetical protein|uniref:hypothetical protein n=1 Tax=Pseudomonas citronellolis TaxID=53408 RepID=UPI00227166BC|nr:hypothetical protein [Pseudomonas citronellolis]WAB90915.1 hypothetical protein OSS47_22710 [Pseudomonas citronellolis]